MERISKKFQKELRNYITTLISAATLLTLVYLFLLNGNVILRFSVAIIALMISGHMISRTNGIGDFLGAYLVGGKHGIKFIEDASKKNRHLWKAFSDWGLVLSFGMLSYFIFKKQINIKTLAFGIATIVVIVLFVYPYLPVMLSFINIPEITSKVSTTSTPGISVNWLPYAVLALTIIGGFGFLAIFLLFYNAGNILYSALLFFLGYINCSTLTQQVPGVAPIIPGLTIPLVAGVTSLVIILIVHEFSHGMLASIAKVKIESIGIILFGIIPMGAFVEPDEREVKKLKADKQDRISIAGISANMLACLFFFVITFIILTYVLPNLNTQGVLVTAVAPNYPGNRTTLNCLGTPYTIAVPNYPANGIIAVNSTILKWNNIVIRNSFDLANAEAGYVSGNVIVTTNLGEFTLTPTLNPQRGRIGIVTAPAVMSPSYQAINFLFTIVALSFGLNFFVAIFNILPIPGFDGWRIYQNRIKSKKILRAIFTFVVIILIINLIPWFYTIP